MISTGYASLRYKYFGLLTLLIIWLMWHLFPILSPGATEPPQVRDKYCSWVGKLLKIVKSMKGSMIQWKTNHNLPTKFRSNQYFGQISRLHLLPWGQQAGLWQYCLTSATPPGFWFLKIFSSAWHFLKSIKTVGFCCTRCCLQVALVAGTLFSCSSAHQLTRQRLCHDSLLPHVYVAAHGRGSLRVSESHDSGQNSQNFDYQTWQIFRLRHT